MIENPKFMSYNTYSFLKSLIESEKQKSEKNYHTASNLIGDWVEDKTGFYFYTRKFDYKKDKRAGDQIYNNYRLQLRVLNNIQAELLLAYNKAAHPNIRKELKHESKRGKKNN